MPDLLPDLLLPGLRQELHDLFDAAVVVVLVLGGILYPPRYPLIRPHALAVPIVDARRHHSSFDSINHANCASSFNLGGPFFI